MKTWLTFLIFLLITTSGFSYEVQYSETSPAGSTLRFGEQTHIMESSTVLQSLFSSILLNSALYLTPRVTAMALGKFASSYPNYGMASSSLNEFIAGEFQLLSTYLRLSYALQLGVKVVEDLGNTAGRHIELLLCGQRSGSMPVYIQSQQLSRLFYIEAVFDDEGPYLKLTALSVVAPGGEAVEDVHPSWMKLYQLMKSEDASQLILQINRDKSEKAELRAELVPTQSNVIGKSFAQPLASNDTWHLESLTGFCGDSASSTYSLLDIGVIDLVVDTFSGKSEIAAFTPNALNVQHSKDAQVVDTRPDRDQGYWLVFSDHTSILTASPGFLYLANGSQSADELLQMAEQSDAEDLVHEQSAQKIWSAYYMLVLNVLVQNPVRQVLQQTVRQIVASQVNAPAPHRSIQFADISDTRAGTNIINSLEEYSHSTTNTPQALVATAFDFLWKEAKMELTMTAHALHEHWLANSGVVLFADGSSDQLTIAQRKARILLKRKSRELNAAEAKKQKGQKVSGVTRESNAQMAIGKLSEILSSLMSRYKLKHAFWSDVYRLNDMDISAESYMELCRQTSTGDVYKQLVTAIPDFPKKLTAALRRVNEEADMEEGVNKETENFAKKLASDIKAAVKDKEEIMKLTTDYTPVQGPDDWSHLDEDGEGFLSTAMERIPSNLATSLTALELAAAIEMHLEDHPLQDLDDIEIDPDLDWGADPDLTMTVSSFRQYIRRIPRMASVIAQSLTWRGDATRDVAITKALTDSLLEIYGHTKDQAGRNEIAKFLIFHIGFDYLVASVPAPAPQVQAPPLERIDTGASFTPRSGKFELRPTQKYLLRVKDTFTRDWYEIGLVLGVKHDRLAILRNNNPNNFDRQAFEMVQIWLQQDVDATWNKFIGAVGELNPHGAKTIIEAIEGLELTTKNLNEHVVPKVAFRWKDFGVQLLEEKYLYKLNIIATNNPRNVERCAQEVLELWMKTAGGSASWSDILLALEKDGQISLVEALSSKIKPMF